MTIISELMRKMSLTSDTKTNNMESKSVKAEVKSEIDESRPNHFILKTPYEGPYDNPNLKQAVFATGCFWGSEKSFWRLPGVYSTAVGYTNGKEEFKNPTYNQICTGKTNHAEAVLVVYDENKISFADLLSNFFQSHDPTQGNGQGNDRGTQYRSGIYLETEEEKQVAEAALKTYEKALGRKITTEIVQPAPVFYYAEDYHQQYLAKPGSRPYCSAAPTLTKMDDVSEWEGVSEELKSKYAMKLNEKYWKKHGPKPHCVIREPHEQIVWEA